MGVVKRVLCLHVEEAGSPGSLSIYISGNALTGPRTRARLSTFAIISGMPSRKLRALSSSRIRLMYICDMPIAGPLFGDERLTRPGPTVCESSLDRHIFPRPVCTIGRTARRGRTNILASTSRSTYATLLLGTSAASSQCHAGLMVATVRRLLEFVPEVCGLL